MLETRLMDRWKRTDHNINGPLMIGLKSANPCHYPEAGFSRPESCAAKTHSRTTSFLPTAPSQPQLNRRFAPTSTHITMAGPVSDAATIRSAPISSMPLESPVPSSLDQVTDLLPLNSLPTRFTLPSSEASSVPSTSRSATDLDCHCSMLPVHGARPHRS